MKKILTLCFVCKGQQILLGLKKRGFGQGYWNGFGGKVKENETIEQAMLREVKEESGLDLIEYSKVGILEFEFINDQSFLQVHVFKSNSFEGQLQENDEMHPQWFDINQIPYEKMWLDDKYWLPLLLAGKRFQGKFKFNGNEDLLEYTVIERTII